MTPTIETELSFFSRATPAERVTYTNDMIDAKYETGQARIVIEMNRERLPLFIASTKKIEFEIQPRYQRRARWSRAKKSRLIESFIMNIPVPPVFLYERRANNLEVMDGQQRVSALRQFYDDAFALTGLQHWPELKGRKYSTLPPLIKAGLDRRTLTSVVMMWESAPDEDSASFLRQVVFERLNTGGVQLSPQEIRNCLYHSPFNELIFELAKHPVFVKAWNLPPSPSANEVQDEEEDEVPLEGEDSGDSNVPEFASTNATYAKMGDVELVLRYFALRHHERMSGSLSHFFDTYMIMAKAFTQSDVDELREQFTESLLLAEAVYGDELFRGYDRDGNLGRRPLKELYDAVMIGISGYLDRKEAVIGQRDAIQRRTKDILIADDRGIFSGKGKQRGDVTLRITTIEQMIGEVIA